MLPRERRLFKMVVFSTLRERHEEPLPQQAGNLLPFLKLPNGDLFWCHVTSSVAKVCDIFIPTWEIFFELNWGKKGDLVFNAVNTVTEQRRMIAVVDVETIPNMLLPSIFTGDNHVASNRAV